MSYCKRHLAQEEKAKRDIDSKSYKSLKNCTSISEPFSPHSIPDLASQGIYGEQSPLCTHTHYLADVLP